MDVDADGKQISCGGSLKMKRDDVIQLSLTFLGFEVGRLEFTPKDGLVVDRIHKQYSRASYAEVDFLRQAGLDFYTLQSLFWSKSSPPEAAMCARSSTAFAWRRAFRCLPDNCRNSTTNFSPAVYHRASTLHRR